MQIMGGWKTWAAAIGMILAGAGLITTGSLADPVDVDKILEGAQMILAGLALIGIGHKLEKGPVPPK